MTIKPNGYETTSRPTDATRTPEQDARPYCVDCDYMVPIHWGANMICLLRHGYGKNYVVKSWDTCDDWTPKRKI